MNPDQTIADGLKKVQCRIHEATILNARSSNTVCLIAVSKNFPAQAIKKAYLAGCKDFGENYAQELKEKVEAINIPSITWHFIGPLQSNKTGIVATYAHWVHSVDRLKIVKRLSDQRPVSLPPLNICIQINISEEKTKNGCKIGQVKSLARAIGEFPNLRLRGLMCIPSAVIDNQLAEEFDAIKKIYDHLRQEGFMLDTLSMGMSNDLELAIQKGATHLRVGRAIFGERYSTT